MTKRLGKLGGFIISSALTIGCGEIDKRPTTTTAEIENEMIAFCTGVASDIQAIVCPVETSDGFKGFMRLECRYSSSPGKLDCAESSNIDVCNPLISNKNACLGEFDNVSSCDIFSNADAYEPDISFEAATGRTAPDNGIGCMTIGSW